MKGFSLLVFPFLGILLQVKLADPPVERGTADAEIPGDLHFAHAGFQHFPQNRTFRFCPGYGQTPISLNHSLAQLLDSYRQIGLSVDPHDNLLPQKSMIGLIGLGNKKHHKTCKHCINLENCYFRKRGQRCYKTD